jgi:hypothetical protein
MQTIKKRDHGGRPPKFQEPSRPITVTLPKRILAQLEAIDTDRARAIVKVTDAVAGSRGNRLRPVELVRMAPGKSLIVVGPSQALRQISGLKLIEIAPARYLLTLPSGMPSEPLEVALSDLLKGPDMQHNKRERVILQELMNLIGHQRRTQRMGKAEVLIISTN